VAGRDTANLLYFLFSKDMEEDDIVAKSSELNACDHQELAKSLSETCLVLLILVITSSYPSFISSDGSPSGDSPSFS